MNQATAPVKSIASGEFLSFRIGQEEYGVDILSVQEIRSFEAPTRMVNAPSHILGVVNLRGTIVPLIDMRIRLGMTEVGYDAFTVAIILNIGTQVVGIVVDSVSDVVALKPEDVKPAPDFSGGMGQNTVLGLASVGQRLIILLDAGKAIGSISSAYETN